MKIHILMAPDPPLFGTTLRALCGAEVPSALPIPLNPRTIQPTNTIIFCKHCLEIGENQFRYFAWIVSGEEGKQLEAGETYDS